MNNISRFSGFVLCIFILLQSTVCASETKSNIGADTKELVSNGWHHTWSAGFGPGGFDVSIDPDGFIYMVGNYGDNVDFDPGPGEDEHQCCGFFLGKFTPSGEHVWARTWKGWPGDVATDNDGNVFVSGTFFGGPDYDVNLQGIDFDPGPGTEFLEPDDGVIFLLKLDSSGEFQWVRTWGSDLGTVRVRTVVDNSGNIYVVSEYLDETYYPPDPDEEIIGCTGNFDMVLSRFDQDGNLQWDRVWGSTDYDTSRGLALDNSGNIYVSGISTDIYPIGPSLGFEEQSDGRIRGTWLVKFNPGGNVEWLRIWDEADGINNLLDISVSDDGYIHIVGNFSGGLDFDPGESSEILEANDVGYGDAYICCLDTSGNFQWAINWGGDGYCSAMAVDCNSSGNPYITGFFLNTVDFDPGPGSVSGTSGDDYGSFMVVLDMNGDYMSSATWGESGYSMTVGIAVDDDGNAIVTGTEDNNFDNDSSDIFLKKISM